MLEELAGLRHKLHTTQDEIINGNSNLLEDLVELNSRMREVNIEMPFIPAYTDDYIDIDTIQIREEIEDVPENDAEREEWYNSTREELYDQLEKLNSKIENYLSEIDSEYKTEYSPSGHTRIFRSSELNKGIESSAKQQTMSQAANEAVAKLHLDNVEIVTDTSNLEEKEKTAKGFYNTTTGKITVVVPNHRDVQDVIMTILHEAVGHKGLRQLVGDKEMDKFTMAIYRNSDKKTREEILALANKHNWRIGVAVEEYIAQQAESMNFDNKLMQLFTKVAELLVELLDKIGIHIGRPMSLRDTRWLLWQSYYNMGKSDVFMNAKRAVIASRLGFDSKSQAEQVKTNRDIRYREAEDQVLNSAAEMYNSAIKSGWSYLREAYQDQYAPVEKLVDAIAKQTGRKMESWENPLYAMNTLSSINLEEKKSMIKKHLEPMWDVISQMQKEMNVTMDDINKYTQLKSGLERNDVFAKRDAKKVVEAEYKKSVNAAKAEYEASIKEAQKIEDTFEKQSATEAAKTKQEESLAKAKKEFEKQLSAIEDGSNPLYLKNREKDYSGLMSWFSETDEIEPKSENQRLFSGDDADSMQLNNWWYDCKFDFKSLDANIIVEEMKAYINKIQHIVNN